MEILNNKDLECKNYKSRIYVCNSLLILIQFISSYQCSIIDPRQLGISAIYILIFSICLQAGQFEGNYLFLSGAIKLERLKSNSQGTATILIILQMIISIILLVQKNYIAIGFFSQYILSGYGFWVVDMNTGIKRIAKNNNVENKYSKSMIKNICIIGILPAIIKCLLLIKNENADFYWIIYSIVITITSVYLIVRYIGIISTSHNVKKYIPKIRFLIAPTIKRAEGNSLFLIIGLTLGPLVLGNLQPIIKLAKSTNILTPIFIKMNYMMIDKVMKRNIFVNLGLIYGITISFGLVVYYLANKYNINFIENISLMSVFIIFVYFSSQNYKSILWALFYKLKLSKQALKDRLNLLTIKVSQGLICYSILKYYNYKSTEFIISMIVIMELIYLLWTTKKYKLENKYKQI